MRKKIKIMQITANLGIGGLERVVVNLAKNIDCERYEPSICCLRFKGEFAKELEDQGIKVHLVQQKKRGTDYFAFWKLKDILSREKPIIVHTHNANAMVDGMIASNLSRVPIKIHTDHARNFPDTWRTMLVEHILSHSINRIIAVSEETKRNLIKYERIARDKIVIIKNGIDGSKYDIQINKEQKKRELGLQQFQYIIGLGVRLTKQKGIIHLVRAVPEVIKEHPSTAIVIAGRGYLLEELRKECRRLSIEKNTFFIGPRLDMAEILQILDLYILPSEWEGLPLVLLEAMAAKRAIVATDVGGNAMAIENQKSGILIPPKRPDILSEKIIDLLNFEKKRNMFAENAYKKYKDQFCIEHMSSEYEKVYERELKKKGYIL